MRRTIEAFTQSYPLIQNFILSFWKLSFLKPFLVFIEIASRPHGEESTQNYARLSYQFRR